jgi:indolepyruvate ferredoxin oxidoreductase beta subunit
MDKTIKQKEPVNVLVVGVGGQGVIMVSKVLATICQEHGYQVKQSEVHGMAKRGGGVFSHVRYGEQVYSPTIPKGSVDVLLALEWAEALRWVNHLRPAEGTFISDTQHIVPPFSCRNRKRGAEVGYARETSQQILSGVKSGFALDATTMARALGNERAANTILLGLLSTTLEFPEQVWRDVISRFVPPKTVDINMQAFEQGRQWADMAPEGPKSGEAGPAVIAPRQVELSDFVQLDINPDWCKSCDICVKMCPERCLKLDDQLKAVLTDPDLCTGCRICEWLCPDYAITVHRTPEAARAAAQG